MYSSDNVTLLHVHIINEDIIILNIHSVTFIESCYSIAYNLVHLYVPLTIDPIIFSICPSIHSFTHLTIHLIYR